MTVTAQLDTRGVAPAARLGYWSAGIAERFFPMQVDERGSAFEARLVTGMFGPVAVGAIQGRPHRAVRTSAMVAAGDPDCILLYLLARGSVRLEQEERSCVLHPGDLACHDTSLPSAFDAEEAFEVLMFCVPRRLLGTTAERIAAHTATRAPTDGLMARLAAPFLMGLATSAATGEPLAAGEGATAAEMLVPLMRGLFAENATALPGSPSESLLARIQQYAVEHLEDPGLGPQSLARAHFVSTRYVHKLFAASGTGVSGWIRERRLEAAAGDLRASPDAVIASVAERWGYRSHTSFSRAFREKYGCAPSEFRHGGRPA